MKMRYVMSLLSAIALSSTVARAEPTWYMDFGIGGATANGHPVPVTGTFPTGDATVTSFSYSPMTGNDMAFTVRGGVRLLPYLAVEASYAHLGDYKLQTGIFDSGSGSLADFDVRARSAGGAIVGILPLAPVDLYARAGYARTELKADQLVNTTQVNVNERFNEAYYGAGARWNVTPELGVFAEYQRHDKLDLDAYFVGMQWRF